MKKGAGPEPTSMMTEQEVTSELLALRGIAIQEANGWWAY